MGKCSLPLVDCRYFPLIGSFHAIELQVQLSSRSPVQVVGRLRTPRGYRPDSAAESGVTMSDTNAVKWLRAQGADFQVLEYTFTEIGADHAAEAVGWPLEAVCKTLLVEASGKSFWIAIIPGDQRFDPRLMAAAIGQNHADLAGREQAEKVTGYHIGGMSPFAMRRKLPVVIEESLLALDKILVNGGRRGVLVELATEDLVHLLDAQTASICR